MIITLGCKTIEYVDRPVYIPVEVEIELEEPPVRTEMEPREEGVSISKHLLNSVAYYSDLVKVWESWGIHVYEAVDLPLPESLMSTKNKLESTDE